MNRLYRYRFVLLAVTGVILVVASVLTLRDGGEDPDRVLGHLGPTPGPNSTGYIEAKGAYLSDLARSSPTSETAALVSLRSYVPAPGAQRMVRGMRPLAVWVRLPSRSQPDLLLVGTTISGAVADAVAELRTTLDDEIADLEGQAAAAEGAERERLLGLAAERKADLAKVSAVCGCVFAFSVTDAAVSDLRELARSSTVRLVDVPQPLTNDLAGWELQPIVPRAGGPKNA